MAVIDANIAVIALAERSTERRHRAQRALTTRSTLHAPAHFLSEAMGTLRWGASGGKITWETAERAVQALTRLGVTLHLPTQSDTERAWELRHNITPPDALYIALAERLDNVFITADSKLARAGQTRCVLHSLDE